MSDQDLIDYLLAHPGAKYSAICAHFNLNSAAAVHLHTMLRRLHKQRKLCVKSQKWVVRP